MELRDALAQIADIRQQIAQTQLFRGYRSVTTAFSGAVAIAAAGTQHLWISDPYAQADRYLGLWLTAAVISLVVVGSEIVIRCRRADSPLQREISLLAVEQFVPCLVAGGLVTYVIRSFAWESLWMLPGLWLILFAMGIFASRRLLPRPIVLVAALYLLAGVVVLALRESAGLSPWTMALTFGPGQLFAAVLLYWTLERRHE